MQWCREAGARLVVVGAEVRAVHVVPRRGQVEEGHERHGLCTCTCLCTCHMYMHGLCTHRRKEETVTCKERGRV